MIMGKVCNYIVLLHFFADRNQSGWLIALGLRCVRYIAWYWEFPGSSTSFPPFQRWWCICTWHDGCPMSRLWCCIFLFVWLKPPPGPQVECLTMSPEMSYKNITYQNIALGQPWPFTWWLVIGRRASIVAIIGKADTLHSLITKGYRMEKRYIPLQCRSLRIFCVDCEQTFSFDGEIVPRRKGKAHMIYFDKGVA